MTILQGKTEFVGRRSGGAGSAGSSRIRCLQSDFDAVGDREESGHTHIGVQVGGADGVVMVPDGAGFLGHRVVVDRSALQS